MRIDSYLISILVLAAGCGGSVASSPGAGVDAGSTDASSADVDAGDAAHAYKADCAKATIGLSQADAPVSLRYLEAHWTLSPAEYGYCAQRNQEGTATFGPIGYLLQITYNIDDSGEDSGAPDVDALAPGAVRLHSDPDLQIETRTDRADWKADAAGVSIPLCLDKKYNDGELLIGLDVANRSGQRSGPWCAGTNYAGD